MAYNLMQDKIPLNSDNISDNALSVIQIRITLRMKRNLCFRST